MAEPSRTAVVTGAGSGLGRAIARALADDGWSVALIGRTRAALEGTAAAGGTLLILPTDVTDERQVDEIAVADWRATVEVNLTGMFLWTRAAVRLMKAQDPSGGRIINNGSISAHVPRPGSVAYTATKHAVTGLTRAVALDGRAHGIAVGQIAIGNASTAMTAGMATGARQADGSVRPEPTFDPAHVATTVVHIARLPLDVSVPATTILATGMPYLGRG